MLTVTVSQLNRYVKAVLEEDRKLRDVYIKGELSGFVRHAKSGHCYFRLADPEGTVRAVMFRQNAELLEFEPSDGMAVLARASVGVFEREGAYQVYVTELLPDGVGAKAVALSQRKARLEAAGAFDPRNKKPIPRFPSRVGVVTSRSGAALQDIRTVIERRWPCCTLVLASALVQGTDAASSLKTALQSLDREGCDVIILSRGGGSVEDLGAFNDEALVLALSGCHTPVISAVGHETDFTLCDYAADARAPTPSAAAELAVPDREALRDGIRASKARLSSRARTLLQEKQTALTRHLSLPERASRMLGEKGEALLRIRNHPTLRSPKNALLKSKETLDIYEKALYNNKRVFIRDFAHQVGKKAGLLDSLSPLRVLDRGYCLAKKEAEIATAATLIPGEEIALLFADGTANAKVLTIEQEGTQ